ncbi:MAG: phosphoribosylamine--glycine ligase [Candidatus Eisenbacteria bacterium]
MRERIVVVGSGGREHALAWRMSRDPEVESLWVAPGNDAMTRRWPRLETADGGPAAMIEACRAVRATLVVIGPEAPLAAGLADALVAAGIATYGPSAAAARLESSKWFAKSVMSAAGVPTARAESFERVEQALAALDRFPAPWVVKADGLAAGKGVRVSADRGETETFVRSCLEDGRFGEPGRRVVIEEFLAGEEASVMAVCDGTRHLLLSPARDFKRALDGDRGPNTGGMGAYAPSRAVGDTLERWVSERIVTPVLTAMSGRGTPFRGTLYVGLMIGADGPRVLEFNARFGDPETQVVLPLTGGSLTRLLGSAARGALDPDAVTREAGACVGVALVDEGYPDAVRGGGRLEGLDRLDTGDPRWVFHAGTVWKGGGWSVRGGRAATVVARDRDPLAARAAVYEAIDTLGGDGWRCRRDIARDSMAEVART